MKFGPMLKDNLHRLYWRY